jgi:hypothetical protein
MPKSILSCASQSALFHLFRVSDVASRTVSSMDIQLIHFLRKRSPKFNLTGWNSGVITTNY